MLTVLLLPQTWMVLLWEPGEAAADGMVVTHDSGFRMGRVGSYGN
jgi:hypothetical protein